MNELNQLKLNQFLEINQNVNLLIEGVIYGNEPSGKNNYRVSGNRLVKTNPELLRYEQDAELQLIVLKARNKIKQHVEGDTALYAKVYFRDRRRDVDTILFCDLLQRCGIVKNDREIRIKIIDGSIIDSKNPRIEFKLFKIAE